VKETWSISLAASVFQKKIFSERLELLRKEFQVQFQNLEEYSYDIQLFQNPFTFETENPP
jgi:hypothetical protein